MDIHSVESVLVPVRDKVGGTKLRHSGAAGDSQLEAAIGRSHYVSHPAFTRGYII